MRQKLAYGLIAVMLLSTVFVSIRQCKSDSNTTPQVATSVPSSKPLGPQVSTPDFNADSAYAFVEKQVKFGYRIPNTEGHRKCSAWLASKFKSYGLEVIEQKFDAKHYTGTTYHAVNIIAQYKPEIQKRILIAAHWDSRYMADHDTKDQNKPIDGADDGASGVGVLLALAQTLAANPVDIGVDLICIDAEDQGDDNGKPETWCLGSQYWSTHLHRPNYMPYQAVLLDMVGAKDAKFFKEGLSMDAAPQLVNQIWSLAGAQGYAEYFVPKVVSGITDDHYFIIKSARIPMIDVVSMPNAGNEHPFPNHHHTHADNMSIIDRNTLKAVGQTMTSLIYQTYNGVL